MIVVVGIAGVSAYVLFGNKLEKKEETPVKAEFSNGQVYAVYKDDTFKIAYPDWPKIDTKNIAEADKIKVAVSNEGCSMFVKEKTLPEGLTLETYTEKVIKDLGDRITVINKEVSENKASLDADIGMGLNNETKMRNISRVFKSGETVYSIAFVAEKSAFDASCGPLLNEVVGSVGVK